MLLVSVFLLSGPLGHAEPVAQQVATIASDLTEYSPGDTVTLTGGGWTPQETVTIVLHRDPFLHPDTVLTSVADASGTITNTSFAPALDDIGVTFFVTASGSQSGLQAFTTFDAKAKKLTWSGAVSTDWNTAGNWDNGVPTASEEAQIPAGLSRYPVIGSNVSVAKVTLESGTGALLTVSGGTLSVSDDITLETGATFNQSGGTVDTGDFVTAAGSSSTQSGGTLRIFRDFKNSGNFNATAGTIVFADNGEDSTPPARTSSSTSSSTAPATTSPRRTAEIRVRGNWTMDGVAEPAGQEQQRHVQRERRADHHRRGGDHLPPPGRGQAVRRRHPCPPGTGRERRHEGVERHARSRHVHTQSFGTTRRG